MTDKEQTELAQIRETRCPACNHESLFVGMGEYITCGNLECPNPDYNQALLDWRDKAVRGVIGEDEPVHTKDGTGWFPSAESRNQLRSEQRARLEALRPSQRPAEKELGDG